MKKRKIPLTLLGFIVAFLLGLYILPIHSRQVVKALEAEKGYTYTSSDIIIGMGIGLFFVYLVFLVGAFAFNKVLTLLLKKNNEVTLLLNTVIAVFFARLTGKVSFTWNGMLFDLFFISLVFASALWLKKNIKIIRDL